MIPIISLLRKMTRNILYVSIVSAFIWAVMHSLQIPLWGLVVFCPFLIYTMAYQYWDEHSRGHALLVVMGIHTLNNATSYILSVIES